MCRLDPPAYAARALLLAGARKVRTPSVTFSKERDLLLEHRPLREEELYHRVLASILQICAAILACEHTAMSREEILDVLEPVRPSPDLSQNSMGSRTLCNVSAVPLRC